jgi:hypothetical protein
MFWQNLLMKLLPSMWLGRLDLLNKLRSKTTAQAGWVNLN